MACCTTINPSTTNGTNQKRPLDYDLTRSNKRRKCGTMYTTLQEIETKINSTNCQIIDANKKELSPFYSTSNTSSFIDNHEQLIERIRNEAKRYIRRRQLNTTSSSNPLLNTTNVHKPSSSPLSSPQISTSHLSSNTNDIPLFTMSQVSAICEKLLKENESKLREQYDSILNQKLNEQYDAFVKFTHEQLQKRFENSQFSYVS